MSHIEVLLIMLAAGVIGGTINYALIREKESCWRDWIWSVIIGTGASLLVPLFLNTISSTLLPGLLSKQNLDADVFVFAGFCLLGAISSKAMIQTLTNRLLKQTEALRRDVNSLKDEVTPIIEKETESDTSASDAQLANNISALHSDLKQMLIELGSSKYSLRSISGLAFDLNKSGIEVINILSELSNLGFAAEVQGKKGLRWTLTSTGRKQLNCLTAQSTRTG